jgi:hypothetical protein
MRRVVPALVVACRGHPRVAWLVRRRQDMIAWTSVAMTANASFDSIGICFIPHFDA